jgi:hypothetical protein
MRRKHVVKTVWAILCVMVIFSMVLFTFSFGF